MGPAIKRNFYLLLIVMLLTADSTWATGLHDDLLKIHAAIVPRTALMDYRFRDKLVDNGILVNVLYMRKDCYYARHFKKYVQEKYKQGLNHIPVRVRILPYKEFMHGQAAPATIYYLLPAPATVIRHAVQHIPSPPLIFAYDFMDLQNHANISVRIGYKVRPVINLDELKARNISLRPAMIKISELFQPRSTP